MMADGQHARRGDDAEQAGLLEIDPPVFGREPPDILRPGSTSPAASASSLAKPALPLAASKAPRHSSLRQAASPCTPTISKKISTESRSAGLERAIQLSTRARQVASEPRHCGFFAITPPLQ